MFFSLNTSKTTSRCRRLNVAFPLVVFVLLILFVPTALSLWTGSDFYVRIYADDPVLFLSVVQLHWMVVFFTRWTEKCPASGCRISFDACCGGTRTVFNSLWTPTFTRNLTGLIFFSSILLVIILVSFISVKKKVKFDFLSNQIWRHCEISASISSFQSQDWPAGGASLSMCFMFFHLQGNQFIFGLLEAESEACPCTFVKKSSHFFIFWLPFCPKSPSEESF